MGCTDYNRNMVSNLDCNLAAEGVYQTDKPSSSPQTHTNALYRRPSIGEVGPGINYLEMEAVLQAVISFKDMMKDQVTLLRTDNSTVAAYINTFNSHLFNVTLTHIYPVLL